MDKWGYNYLIGQKTLCEKEKLLVTNNFFFSHNVFKSCLLLIRQNEYDWSKGLKLRAYELFEDSDADLSSLQKKPTCTIYMFSSLSGF